MPTSNRRGEDDSASVNPSALFDVPSALAAFYAKIGTEGSLSCDKGGGVGTDKRPGGYKTNGEGKDGTRYCADSTDEPSFVWWQSNMDIDCDGSDGKGEICNGDGSYLPDTAFQDDQGKNIDAKTIQYVVIDQDDDFDPTKFGIQPLSTVAVLCAGKLTFGVWADTNALGSMGEASVHLGRVCFGSKINGNYGHGEPDVLYVAFPGSKAETVPSGYGKDEEEMFEVGKALVDKAFGGGGGAGSGTGSGIAGGTGSSAVAASTADTESSPTSSEPAAGTSPSTATRSTSTPAATPADTSTSSPSSAALPSSSSSFLDSLKGSSTGPILLILAGVAILLAASTAWWCTHRRAPQHAAASALRRSSREDSSSSVEDSTSGSSTDEESGSEDEKRGEGERLYREEGRRRYRRRWS